MSYVVAAVQNEGITSTTIPSQQGSASKKTRAAATPRAQRQKQQSVGEGLRRVLQQAVARRYTPRSELFQLQLESSGFSYLCLDHRRSSQLVSYHAVDSDAIISSRATSRNHHSVSHAGMQSVDRWLFFSAWISVGCDGQKECVCAEGFMGH